MMQNATESATEAQTPAEPKETFDVLPLSAEVRRAIDEMGYTNPTPVQRAVWEPVTRGQDAVVQARTGTGKTASFGLPIVDNLVRRNIEKPQVLVLCPTRELAIQVAGEIEKIAKYREIKVLPIYGGASMEKQLAGIHAGAQVIVGTPGRVLDHIRRQTLPVDQIRLLVLDEADEMLSMGFERELTAILESLPSTRQSILFSATLPPDIERMAKNRLKNPEFLTLSGDHVGALSIQHFTYLVNADKLGTLLRILEAENPEGAVIFCNTKEATENVARSLADRGYDADWLNGDLAQGEREKVMSRTRKGELRFLVATDVAARGIDVSHLTHVINYDFPQDAESYVHRTGRTGRAGRTGTAIALITPKDIGSLYYLRLTYKIRPIERELPTAEELKTRAEADLVASLCSDLGPRGTQERALARRLLTHEQAESAVAGLLAYYLLHHPDAQAAAEKLRITGTRRVTLKTGGDAPIKLRPREDKNARRERQRTDRGDLPEGAGFGSDAPALVGSVVAPTGVAGVGSAGVGLAEAGAMNPAAGSAGAEGAPDAGAGRSRRRERDDRGREDRGRGGRGDRGRSDRGGPDMHEPVRGFPAADAPAHEGLAHEGLAHEGLAHEGLAHEGLAREGSAREGSAREGSAREGSARESSARESSGPRGNGAEAQSADPRQGRNRRSRGEDRAESGQESQGSQADGSRERSPARQLASWAPREEEGDDEPLMPARRADSDRRGGREDGRREEGRVTESTETTENFGELFVGVGRRDGVRAQDILKILTEQAGLDGDAVKRIRVRDRHTFVGVPKEHLEPTIQKLHGTTISGREGTTVEIARERNES